MDLQNFWSPNITVVIATDETLYLLTVFDAMEVILCITLVSFSHEISMNTTLFEVAICIYPLFRSLSEKTPRSYHFLVLLHRQHFLLNYLKTLLSGDPTQN